MTTRLLSYTITYSYIMKRWCICPSWTSGISWK